MCEKFFFIVVNRSYCASTSPSVNLSSNVFDKQRGTLKPDSHDTLILAGVLGAMGYTVNNPLAAIKGALTMIIMIKGIHLITGLLNYSSVEARLFGRMLIIPLHSWQDFYSDFSLNLSPLSFLEPNIQPFFMQIYIWQMFCDSLFPYFFEQCSSLAIYF